MTDRTVAHSTFVIERTYPAAPQQVFRALSDPARKRRWFAEGEGPRLEPVDTQERLAAIDELADDGKLTPIIETVQRVRGTLPRQTGFIGCCGAPWTVAPYMVAGRGTPAPLSCRFPSAFGRGRAIPRRPFSRLLSRKRGTRPSP